MVYHNRKLFLEEYRPRAFSFPIFRPLHAPEGSIGIYVCFLCRCLFPSFPSFLPLSLTHTSSQSRDATGVPLDPIHTSVSYAPASRLMRLPLGASTNVEFGGDRFVHGWVNTEFGKSAAEQIAFVARARQFSSFIVVLGNIAGPDLFSPKHAIVVQNKVRERGDKIIIIINNTSI